MSNDEILQINIAIAKASGRDVKNLRSSRIKIALNEGISDGIPAKEISAHQQLIINNRKKSTTKNSEQRRENKTDIKKPNIITQLEISDIISNTTSHDSYTSNNKYQPNNPLIIEASEYIIGKGILGVAFIYKNIIMVLDRFYGTLKDKILDHEKRHLKRPDESEFVVRRHTDTLYTSPFSSYLN
jgi:hypothetical protein